VKVPGSAATELVDAVEAKNGPGLRPGQPQRPLLQVMGQGNPIGVTCRGSDHTSSERTMLSAKGGGHPALHDCWKPVTEAGIPLR